jgi:hypothetical protein
MQKMRQKPHYVFCKFRRLYEKGGDVNGERTYQEDK